MKRKFVMFVIMFVMAFLFLILGISSSHAALLGIRESLGYPDIWFSNGTISYTYDQGSNQGIFTLEATDLLLTLPPDNEYYLSGTGYETKLSLALTFSLDNQGKPVFNSGSMIEEVESGSFFIDKKTYSQGDALLSGRVYAFGWSEGSDLGKFDLLIDNLAGKLVDDGMWPGSLPVGLYMEATELGGWTGTWNHAFQLSEVTGDKAPVPVPASILLFGSGFGLFGLGRLRTHRLQRRREDL